MLQNKLVGSRQEELRRMTGEQQAAGDRAEVLKALLPKVMAGEITPDQFAQATGIGRDRSASLAPSRGVRLRDIGKEYESSPATIPENVPEFVESEVRRRSINPVEVNRVEHPTGITGLDAGFIPEMAPIIQSLQARRAGGRMDLSRTRAEGVDPAGNKTAEFLTNEQLGGRTFPQERTPEQGASFARRGLEAETAEGIPALKGKASVTEALAGEFSPAITKAKAGQAGAIAGAERSAQLAAELNRMGITGQQQTAALTLADDFERASSEFFTVDRSFKRIASMAQSPSPMGDIGMVFAIMKMYDPPSTVREGEQAQASNAAGVPERIRTTYNRLLTGEKLGTNQRADILTTARNLYNVAKVDQDQIVRDFTGRAQQLRVPPSLVLRAPTEVAESALDRTRRGGR